ncbi:MAG: molybdate ABC transporter substrate-binding protein [Alphaproteobacteria bacterium]|nr:molybdate ABC transporter substrate-binding protein [Alphaproteobacteria bacterium]
MIGRRWILGGVLAALVASGTPAAAQQPGPLVFAAASLKNALDEINAAWRAETGKTARISFAASSTLARQVEQGAPADILISADLDWMDWLQQRDLIQPATRVNLLGNRLVLIVPASATATVDIRPGFDLAGLLGPGGRLAMGETRSVPAGKYGRAALEHLGVWPSVQARIAQAESVRAALVLVARGEAPVGIVYRTDAVAEPGVRVAGTFPEETHPPIIYPVALTRTAAGSDAAALVAYLRGAAASRLFEKQGLTVLR